MNIFIFDPSLGDNAGAPPTNLGDIIIRRAVDEIINEIFPQAVITRASSHICPTPELLSQALAADLVLVGGTNLLSSHVMDYNQWKMQNDPEQYAAPPNLNAVLLGVGWWQYQDEPDSLTQHYYNQILHPSLPHSVRDSYTHAKLKTCGVPNILNTTCPTLWKLHGLTTRRKGSNRQCLFCLTDYKPAPEEDSKFIQLLLRYYDNLIFFPQGSQDLKYIATLPVFDKAAQQITLLPHDINAFYQMAGQEGLDYIGTRLHAGAWCMEHNLPSLILAVDNRSQEIANDINLPVVARWDQKSIEDWLNKNSPDKAIALPKSSINAWKKQMSTYAPATKKRPGMLQRILPWLK